jgi:hypothetical protein
MSSFKDDSSHLAWDCSARGCAPTRSSARVPRRAAVRRRGGAAQASGAGGVGEGASQGF